MRAPAFWYRDRVGFAALALAPLSALYQFGVKLRAAFAKPYRSRRQMICIGNIVAGGAGKTPTALAVAGLLHAQGASPIFVTRGYGASEQGPLQVDPARHTARHVGDEALILAKRTSTVIGRKRVRAVKMAETLGSHIILDDGLQNPTLAPDVSFLVIDAATGLGNGETLPAGPLRETLASALKRVTAVIIIGKTVPDFLKNISTPVLQAELVPVLPVDFPAGQSFVAFAGIGRPEKFFVTCRQAGLTVTQEISFPDHHFFSQSALNQLERIAAAKNSTLLTTEKDWVRLPREMQARVFVLPVKLRFAEPDILASYLT